MSHPPANWNTDAFIERIVREVIRRLLAMEASSPTALKTAGRSANVFADPVVSRPHSISAKLITTATLESVPTGTTEVLIVSRAVVTPLARDEAKSKGIRLTRSDHLKEHKPGASG